MTPETGRLPVVLPLKCSWAGVFAATTTRLDADPDGSVGVENVFSHRRTGDVPCDLEGFRRFVGDLAWGDQWFFLVDADGDRLEPSAIGRLTDLSCEARQAVRAKGYPEVDHVNLLGPTRGAGAHSHNFVSCLEDAYDRSPGGTGTSARVARLTGEAHVTSEATLLIEESDPYRWGTRSVGGPAC